jgi:hypothetical protein
MSCALHLRHDTDIASVAPRLAPAAGPRHCRPNQPDAYRVPAGHQSIAVVLDLVNPVGARGRTVGRRREAGFDKAGGHAAYLGGRIEESNLLP